MSDGETFGHLLHGTARTWRQKLDERLKPMGTQPGKVADPNASVSF